LVERPISMGAFSMFFSDYFTIRQLYSQIRCSSAEGP
jgi:hypothetical protein